MATLRVVAIDGPAGAGKSTVGRALAERLGLEYLDTGAMYRCVTVAALERDVDLHDPEAVGALARSLDIAVGDRVTVDGTDVTTAIRTPEVNAAVSIVAANPAVREEMRSRQRSWGEIRGGGVIEGRDIGTVVFPDAVLKLYLTASPRIRAERRVAEAGGDVDEIERAIAERDHLDSTRADGPLRQADGGMVLDTSGLAINEVLECIVAMLDQGGARP